MPFHPESPMHEDPAVPHRLTVYNLLSETVCAASPRPLALLNLGCRTAVLSGPAKLLSLGSAKTSTLLGWLSSVLIPAWVLLLLFPSCFSYACVCLLEFNVYFPQIHFFSALEMTVHHAAVGHLLWLWIPLDPGSNPSSIITQSLTFHISLTGLWLSFINLCNGGDCSHHRTNTLRITQDAGAKSFSADYRPVIVVTLSSSSSSAKLEVPFSIHFLPQPASFEIWCSNCYFRNGL